MKYSGMSFTRIFLLAYEASVVRAILFTETSVHQNNLTMAQGPDSTGYLMIILQPNSTLHHTVL